MRIIGGTLTIIGAIITGYGVWMYTVLHHMMTMAGKIPPATHHLPHPQAAVYQLVDWIGRSLGPNPSGIGDRASWIIYGVIGAGVLLVGGGIAGALIGKSRRSPRLGSRG